MVGFFIKKAFFDGWDNLIGLVLFNLIYIALIFLGLWGFSYLAPFSPVLSFLLLAVVLLAYSLIAGGTAAVVSNYSNYQRDSWNAFRSGIVRNIRHSLLFFALEFLFFMNILLIIPFYMAMAWIEIFIALAMAYYFPLMNLLPGDRSLKTLKKCLIIIGDNLGFTFFLVIYRLFMLVVSIFTMGLIPGVAGAQLAGQDAMKILMFKYDYLDENKAADRKHIPWEELLFDEREKVGPRSLKNMIFPWK